MGHDLKKSNEIKKINKRFQIYCKTKQQKTQRQRKEMLNLAIKICTKEKTSTEYDTANK